MGSIFFIFGVVVQEYQMNRSPGVHIIDRINFTDSTGEHNGWENSAEEYHGMIKYQQDYIAFRNTSGKSGRYLSETARIMLERTIAAYRLKHGLRKSEAGHLAENSGRPVAMRLQTRFVGDQRPPDAEYWQCSN